MVRRTPRVASSIVGTTIGLRSTRLMLKPPAKKHEDERYVSHSAGKLGVVEIDDARNVAPEEYADRQREDDHGDIEAPEQRGADREKDQNGQIRRKAKNPLYR